MYSWWQYLDDGVFCYDVSMMILVKGMLLLSLIVVNVLEMVIWCGGGCNGDSGY